MAAEYSRSGIVRERAGNIRSWSIPGDQFLTQDGKWVLILALNPQIFQRLCDAMNIPDLPQDPKFSNHQNRFANVVELLSFIREWVNDFDFADLYGVLDEYRVP